MNSSIEHLDALWSSLDGVLGELSEADWKRPTGCPGWTVQDNVAHLIDYESRALGRGGPGHTAADTSHTKNDLGVANEDGVDYRRQFSGAEVLAEFREVTAARSAQLRALTDDDFARQVQTPAGLSSVADMLTLRVMDTWSHEQDIRRAVGRPGHTEGPAVDEAVGYFLRYVPLVIARRAEPADGDVVVLEIGSRPPFAVEVKDGRGSVVEPLDAARAAEPTVVLRMPVGTFGALVGKRSDADLATVDMTGDRGLGDRVVAALGFMI